MFEDFEATRVQVDGASILVRHGGEGPTVVLLHGHPRTSATWHRVAPLLVRRGFTVVCRNADPDSWYRGDPQSMGQENYDEWRAATRNPDVVRAMLEDYRAGLTVDRRHEEDDRTTGTRVRIE